MDKEFACSKKNKIKNCNERQTKEQENFQNETEEKFVKTTENESGANDDNANLKNLSNKYINLDILISKELQSLGNNQVNKQISSNLIKKQNNLNNVNNLNQKYNFPKQSVLKELMSRSHTDNSNEDSIQSISILLNKNTNNSKELNSSNYTKNKNKNKDSNKKKSLEVVNNSKDVRKKTISTLSSNSSPSSCLPKNYSPKTFMNYHLFFSQGNIKKTLKNKNLLYFPKSDNQLNKSNFHDENSFHKHIMKRKKNSKNSFKKKLSNDNYNNYPYIIRIKKSLKTPKNLRSIISPQLKRRKNSSTLSISPASQSRKNSELNLKKIYNLTPVSTIRSHLNHGKNRKLHKKQKIKLNFSNFMQEYNNNLEIRNKKKEKSNTSLITNKIQEKNLYTILSSNKPNEIKDANKIMNIITMDEVNRKIKETIIRYDKETLLKEIRDLETNEICEAIDKLPIMNNSSLNNKNEQNYSKNEDNNNINESNKKTYISTKKSNKIYNNLTEAKLGTLYGKYRKLIHKKLVYDSLDDEELEEVKVNIYYIAPNSLTVYLIDFIILISSLIQLLYVPIFLAHNLEFCRNFASVHQLMFYLIDLFYILDLITGFFRAYYNFDEFLIKDINKICKNYLTNWFFIDCIEAIPLYIIFNLMEKQCEVNDIYFSNYYNKNINKLKYILLQIKIFKIFKLISENTILKNLTNKLNDYDFFFERKFILFTIFIIFSFLNISSCLFIFLGRNTYPGWIIECNIQNNSFAYIYLTSVYYLMTTVTTVGYGDLSVTSIIERIYQIIILIVGTCAYSWTITYISNYIQKIQEKSINYEKKISILEDIKLSSENFTTELYDKIHRYLKYNRVDKKSNNEILINCLPYPLKNNLFMEMYKNIIKNFKIFKSFENSNFIVKVVTSFKPVLTIKNDILVQEGDFIEDIIFVKEGILSLEICIDLDNVQESIEAYLNEVGFGKSVKLTTAKIKKFETFLYPYKNTFNSNELKFNEILTNYTKGKELCEKNKKYLRVVDFRKNEYYGEILMFLNERASHRVKVKSKKAELFYLNKTDAIEISTLYPNIWKKIIKKSLINMKQVKNLTRKILICFSKLNGIYLNEEVFEELNSSNSISQKSNFNNNSQITENIYNSSKPINLEKEEETSNNINSNISSVIYEEENENENNEPVTNSVLNCEIKETNKKYTNNPKFNNKKISKKNIKNINDNIENKNINNFVNQKKEKLPEYNDYLEINKFCRSIYTENEVNSEIHQNEKFNDNKYIQSDFSEINKNCIDIDEEENVDKKLVIKYKDNGFEINNEKEIKCENDKYSVKNDDKKTKTFENLSKVNATNTTIISIYENINQISKYKFSKDINLRKKTIQFLKEESNKYSSIYTVVDSNIVNNSLFINRYAKNSKEISSHKIKSKNSNYDEDYKLMISLNKDEFSESKDTKSIHQTERNSSKLSKLDSIRHLSPQLNKSNNSKINYALLTTNHKSSKKCAYRNQIFKLFENVRKKSSKKKEYIHNLADSPDDQELNFYGKIKTLCINNNNINNKNNNITIISNNNEVFKNFNKKNYLDMISQNIEQNQQTLKNPQEFYTELFANIVQKGINNRRKSDKNKKGVNAKKFFEFNKSKIRNNKYINNEEGKIKNSGTIKKRGTTKDVIK